MNNTKKIAEVSDRFGTKVIYGYEYEISVKSDSNGFQTIINNNNEKDISNGFIYIIRIERINPKPTSIGGRFCFDGVHKCFERGLYLGGLIIKQQPYIYSTTLDGEYNIEDVIMPDKIYSLNDIDFNLKKDCEIKVIIYVCTKEFRLPTRTNAEVTNIEYSDNYMYDDVVKLLKQYNIENKELAKELTIQKFNYAKTYTTQLLNIGGDTKQEINDYRLLLDNEVTKKIEKIK